MSKSAKNISHDRLSAYIVGYIVSVLLTIDAYFLVVHHAFEQHQLVVFVMILAMLQFFAQLFFFLHLGSEPKPRWKLTMLLFMATVVIILIGGSLWIISNLNYNMTQDRVNKYLNSQDGL